MRPIALGTPLPPPPPSGGLVGAVTDPNKPKLHVPKEPTQPVPKPLDLKPSTTDGKIVGPPGPSTTVGPIIGTCLQDCEPETRPAVPACGNSVLETGEQCDDSNQLDGDGCSSTCRTEERPRPVTQIVNPSVLRGLRISGETQLHPSTVTQNQMMRDGVSRVNGVVKLCLDAAGGVASAKMLVSTRYDAYDQALLAAVRDWRYQPYLFNGTAVPACSTVTFLYTIR